MKTKKPKKNDYSAMSLDELIKTVGKATARNYEENKSQVKFENFINEFSKYCDSKGLD